MRFEEIVVAVLVNELVVLPEIPVDHPQGGTENQIAEACLLLDLSTGRHIG